jgi:hypothetical protein
MTLLLGIIIISYEKHGNEGGERKPQQFSYPACKAARLKDLNSQMR